MTFGLLEPSAGAVASAGSVVVASEAAGAASLAGPLGTGNGVDWENVGFSSASDSDADHTLTSSSATSHFMTPTANRTYTLDNSF